MTLAMVAAIAGLGVFAGLLIGCIGIGGVILVPALTFIGGVPVHVAIAAAMMAYIVSGLLATFVFVREQRDNRTTAYWLWCGAMPAALAGAWAAKMIPSSALEVAIGTLVLFSGLNAFWQEHNKRTQERSIDNSTATVLGGLGGFGSALTGTGGPLVLVPGLLWLGAPVLTAIRLGQSAQFPIASVATLGNFLYGELDLTIGLILLVSVTMGSAVGTRVSQVLPRVVLRRIVSVTLVVIGATILTHVVGRSLTF